MIQPWDWDELPKHKQLDLMAWYEVNLAEKAQAQRESEKASRAPGKGKVRGGRRR